MISGKTKTLIACAVIIAGFIAVFALSGFLEKVKPELPESYADEDLALQGAKLKGYDLGFDGLIADWYWMSALQYVGEKLLKNPATTLSIDDLNPLNPRLLYPLLDNATTLDPRFTSVYEYGALVLPAIDKQQAIKFVEKGIADNPDEWRLYHHLGYIYWRLEDYEKASEVYQQGAKISGAPPFMQMMAANMQSQGGSRDTARAMYRQMYNEAQDEQAKENAALRLLQIDSYDERDAINPVLKDFQNKNGRCPNDWREIFPFLQKTRKSNGGDLRIDAQTLAPVDPSDAPYIISEEKGACVAAIDYKKSKVPFN